MSVQYLRRAKLTVANKVGQGFDFEGLRVSGKIVKSNESNANTAEISIYNLSDNSRFFFEEENLFISLDLGYAGIDDLEGNSTGSIENVFKGNISKDQGKTSSFRDGSEWVTKIEAGDGEKELQTSHTEISFGKGTPFTAIINQLLQTFGLAKGSQAVVGEGIARNGFSASGKSKDILDRLAERFGFTWSVQSGALQVTRNNIPTPEVATVVSPTTGLISSVIKREKGVEFTTLLNPQILPGRAVNIIQTATIASGFFKVTRVVMDFDTHGPNWTSQVEALPL